MRRITAFTLLELVVVMAVMAILAALLIPMAASVRAEAKKSLCLSHFRQVGIATHLYVTDYDDMAVVPNHDPGQTPNSRSDRTWVQLLLPYASSFQVFQCPEDSWNRNESSATFDQDLVPGDIFSQLYTASLHSNVGYNFQYLSPIVQVGSGWIARPNSLSELPNPSQMLLFADSAWSVKNGQPQGGGSWLVEPPCRYATTSAGVTDTIAPARIPQKAGSVSSTPAIFAPTQGWNLSSDSTYTYGGVWPWHLNRTNMCTVDGSARSVSIAQLTNGCDVQPDWSGTIYNRGAYIWSPE